MAPTLRRAPAARRFTCRWCPLPYPAFAKRCGLLARFDVKYSRLSANHSEKRSPGGHGSMDVSPSREMLAGSVPQPAPVVAASPSRYFRVVYSWYVAFNSQASASRISNSKPRLHLGSARRRCVVAVEEFLMSSGELHWWAKGLGCLRQVLRRHEQRKRPLGQPERELRLVPQRWKRGFSVVLP